MGFMNRIGDLFKGEEDYENEYDEYEEDEDENEDDQAAAAAVAAPAATPKAAPKAAPVSRSTGGISSGAALEMKVIKPERFDEVRMIGEHLLARRTVVLNLEETNKETTKRIIDFLGGVVFAIDGQVKKVANATYIVTPKNVDVSGEQSDATAETPAKPRELFR